jgi:hypothetical protein
MRTNVKLPATLQTPGGSSLNIPYFEAGTVSVIWVVCAAEKQIPISNNVVMWYMLHLREQRKCNIVFLSCSNNSSQLYQGKKTLCNQHLFDYVQIRQMMIVLFHEK